VTDDRRREICRTWKCSPEDANRLDTPLRWKAWDVWVRGESGTARDFMTECRRCRDVFRDALDRMRDCDDDLFLIDAWPPRTVAANRYAIIMCDAAVRLMPMNPSIVACVAADVKTDWHLGSTDQWYVTVAIPQAAACRKVPSRLDIAGTYRNYSAWLMQTWATHLSLSPWAWAIPPNDAPTEPIAETPKVPVYRPVPGPRGPMRIPSWGMLLPGTIDLSRFPILRNRDGSFPPLRTCMAENDHGHIVLQPTVAYDGHLMSEEDASAYWDGQSLGVFETRERAEAYDTALHVHLFAQWRGQAA
jgi:hypothetical protein